MLIAIRSTARHAAIHRGPVILYKYFNDQGYANNFMEA